MVNSINDGRDKTIYTLSIIFLILVMIPSINAITTQRVINYLPFNESQGTTEFREIIYGQNCSTNGAAAMPPGQINNSWNISGGIYCSANAGLNMPVSISFWYKVNTLADDGTNPTGYSRPIIIHSNSGAASDWSYVGLSIGEWSSSSGSIYVEDKNDKYSYTLTKLNTSTWYHVAVVEERGSSLSPSIYLNGVNQSLGSNTAIGLFEFGSEWKLGTMFKFGVSPPVAAPNGVLDDLIFFNYTLTQQNITDIYQNGLNGTTYPWNTTGGGATGCTPAYNITTSQYPLDINTTFVGSMVINASVLEYCTNYTGTERMVLYSNMTISLNGGCPIFFQKNCVQSPGTYLNTNMTRISNTLYTARLIDQYIYPGYYPYNYTTIDNTPERYNYTIYNNNYMRFLVYNMTESTTGNILLFLEMNAINKTDSSTAMAILYCNQSYVSGNPLTNSNCEVVDSFVPTTMYNHIHTFAKHQAIALTIRNVTRTQNSSFIFLATGTSANGWNFEYILNNSYDNTSFQTGNYVSWAGTNKIFDTHFHFMRDTDYISYYAGYTGNGSTAVSSIVYDFYNLTQFPPNAPVFLSPGCPAEITLSSNDSSIIYFNWTISNDINNDSVYQSLYLIDSFGDKHYLFTNLTGLLNFTFNNQTTSTLTESSYSYRLISCDYLNNCDISIPDCGITTCTNSYQSTLQPCIGGVKLTYFEDINNCGTEFDIPSANGTYSSCTYIQDMRISLDSTIYFHFILLLLFIISLFIGLRSDGAFKSMIAISGVILVIYSVMFESIFLNDPAIVLEYHMFIRIAEVVLGLFGLLLVYLGIMSWIESRASRK